MYCDDVMVLAMRQVTGRGAVSGFSSGTTQVAGMRHEVGGQQDQGMYALIVDEDDRKQQHARASS